MSTAPTRSRPSPGTSWGLVFVSFLGICSFAAAVANDTGQSERFARLYPSMPPLPLTASLLVPVLYLGFRALRAAVRWIANAGQRDRLISASIAAVAVLGTMAVVARADESPRSPARLPGPASYYDLPGDASILEAHVTHPPGTSVAGGITDYKIFRLRNTGKVDWVGRWLCRADPEMSTRDNLQTHDCVRIPTTPAGEAVEVRVRMRVANRDGVLVAAFKMSDGQDAWYYRDATPVYIRVEANQR